MKKNRCRFFLVPVLLLVGAANGCYQRPVSSTYGFEESAVEKIRQQLGAVTVDKEYVNEEEEEE